MRPMMQPRTVLVPWCPMAPREGRSSYLTWLPWLLVSSLAGWSSLGSSQAFPALRHWAVDEGQHQESHGPASTSQAVTRLQGSVDQGWCQAWFGMQVPFFCQAMSNSDNSGNEMIISNWPFWLQKKYAKKHEKRLNLTVLHVLKKAWICRAVLLGWFKINAGLVRQIPWSLTKAQEEAAAKSNGWILGITVRHPLEGPGGFNEFGVWAIRHHTAIACHSQIRILGITSGQIWLRLRLRFFRICGDPWSWKAGIMLYPRCIQMFLSGRVHIQSFLWKNKRTLQHFAGCKRMRYEFLPKAVGHIYIYK